MTIYGRCRECGYTAALEAFADDIKARTALAAALALPSALAETVLEYLPLHSAPGQRMRATKYTRLLQELLALIESGQVTRNRDTRPAPAQAWADGMRSVIEKHDAGTVTVPLNGHGLLCTIVHARAAAAALGEADARRALHPSHQRHDPATERRAAGGAEHVREILGRLKGRGADPMPVNQNHPEDEG